MIELVAIPRHMVPTMWPKVQPFVEAAAHRGRSIESADEYRDSCRERKRQLWAIMDISNDNDVVGCVITEIYDTTAGRTCALPIASGKEHHIASVLDTIEAWAREQDCTRLEGCGRLGWSRTLAAFGWKPVSVTIEKELV